MLLPLLSSQSDFTVSTVFGIVKEKKRSVNKIDGASKIPVDTLIVSS